MHKLAYGHVRALCGLLCVVKFNTHRTSLERTRLTVLSTHLSFFFTYHWENIMLNSILYFISGVFVVPFCIVSHKSQQITLSDIYKSKILNFLEVHFSISHFILIYLDPKRFNSSLYFSFLNS